MLANAWILCIPTWTKTKYRIPNSYFVNMRLWKVVDILISRHFVISLIHSDWSRAESMYRVKEFRAESSNPNPNFPNFLLLNRNPKMKSVCEIGLFTILVYRISSIRLSKQYIKSITIDIDHILMRKMQTRSAIYKKN